MLYNNYWWVTCALCDYIIFREKKEFHTFYKFSDFSATSWLCFSISLKNLLISYHFTFSNIQHHPTAITLFLFNLGDHKLRQNAWLYDSDRPTRPF
jgi:hypothetical protein